MATETIREESELVARVELGHTPDLPVEVKLALPITELPEDDPVYRKLAQAGIIGSALVDIAAGGEQLIVIDASKTAVGNQSSSATIRRYTPFSGQAATRSSSPREFNSPYVLVHINKAGRVKGVSLDVKAAPTIVGRDDDIKDDRFTLAYYSEAPSLSRHHFSIEVDDDKLHVVDLGSREGTQLRYSSESTVSTAKKEDTQPEELRSRSWLARNVLSRVPGLREQSTRSKPDYANALDMHTDELWALANNGGRASDERHERYIDLYKQIRKQVVGDFIDGNIYKDTDAFTDFLKKLHRTPGLAENYNDLVSADKRIELDTVGELKTHTGTAPRIAEPTRVAELAVRLGDPYSTQGAPGEPLKRLVKIPNIPEKYLAKEVIEYLDNGERRSIYTYPHAEGLSAYMEQATDLGKVIESSIKSGNADPDQVLELIAHQYQYLIMSRPFRRINNSLFMQLANAQIKMLGYNGMTHGILDHAAYRLTYEHFAKYFVGRVKGTYE